MTQTTKRSELIAEELGKEAIEALKTGKSWSYQPDSTEHVEAWPIRSDDQWYKMWFVAGYDIEDGKLLQVTHTCDEDGNWDVDDSCDVDSSEYDEWASHQSYETFQQEWITYAEWVAKTGRDPLHNYNVDRTHKETWVAKLGQDEYGVTFLGAHRRSLAFFEKIATIDPRELPQPVRDFLQVDATGHVVEIKSLDDLKGGNYKIDRHDGIVIVTFEVDIFDRYDVVAERVKQAAMRHLGEDE